MATGIRVHNENCESGLAGGRGVGLCQQFAGVGDQIADLERFHQKRNILFFQVASDFGLGQTGESKQNVM